MTWGLKKTAALIIGIYLLFCAGLLYWVVIYSGSGDGDTLEHVHSSWLVWSGKIPYKDFFQHHNPLLWYVGAPLVGFYEYSLRAVDAVNMLTVTAFLLMLFYIYRLHRDFLSGRFGGLVAAAFVPCRRKVYIIRILSLIILWHWHWLPEFTIFSVI